MRRPPELVTSIARETQMHLTRKRIKCTIYGVLSISKLTPGQEGYYERSVAAALYQPEMPDPDLLIRTAGEMRISNFLLWQLAYAEIHVTQTLWPDFDRDALLEAIAEYQSRQRKFGAVPAIPAGVGAP